MTFNVLIAVILLTVAVSIKAFNDRALLERFMFIPYDCKHNNRYYRFLSHTLIHADWAHLGFNMMSLYFLGKGLLGQSVEVTGAYGYTEVFGVGLTGQFGQLGGQIHFLILYVLGGLFSTLWPYVKHQDNFGYRSLGASGAVSAVIFAAIIWNPGWDLRLLFIPIDIPAYIFGPLYLAFEFYMNKRGNTGIAHDAHIGGAIFGIIYVLIINIDKGKEFLSYFI